MRTLPVVLVLAILGCSRAPSSTTATSAATPNGAAPAASRATDHFATGKGDLAVTPLNHGSVLFESAGKAIYADPTMVAVADASLPKADAILLTHTHPDHLDPAALDRLRKPGTIVVGPQAVAEKTHVDVVMNNGDTRQVLGAVVTAVPMYNLQRGPEPGKLYHPKGDGNGYVIDFAGTRVYLSGDTECTPEMRALEKIDVAFVCMNLPYTMPPAEAAQCIEAFRPRILFPYHFRGSDLGELDRALSGKGIEIRKRTWY